jgi:hypothetical protein
MKDHHPSLLGNRVARATSVDETAMVTADHAVVDAIIAASALVALADGLVVARERQHLIRLICGNSALAKQSAAQIEQEFALQSRLRQSGGGTAASPASDHRNCRKVRCQPHGFECLPVDDAGGWPSHAAGDCSDHDTRNALKLDPSRRGRGCNVEVQLW